MFFSELRHDRYSIQSLCPHLTNQMFQGCHFFFSAENWFAKSFVVSCLLQLHLSPNRKYQPRIHVVEETEEGVKVSCSTYVFPETTFIAVTTYQNEEVCVQIKFHFTVLTTARVSKGKNYGKHDLISDLC